MSYFTAVYLNTRGSAQESCLPVHCKPFNRGSTREWFVVSFVQGYLCALISRHKADISLATLGKSMQTTLTSSPREEESVEKILLYF